MQGHSGTSPRDSRGRAQGLRLFINPRSVSLDERNVVFRYTGNGGYVCLSFGAGAKFLQAAKENPTLRKRIAADAARLLRDKRVTDPDLARFVATVALSKDYDPDEPRDEQGRWSSEGAAGAVAGAVADAARMFGNPAYAEGLRQLAARAFAALPSLPAAAAAIGDVARAGSPAAAFFGTLFLPAPRHLDASDGTLPDAPDYSYHFDQEAGHLTITHTFDDGTSATVFDGRYDKDGVFRDADGNAIGRFLGDSVALDADAVRGYEARRRSDAAAPPGAIAQSTATTRDDPKVCPAPEPDKPGGKNNAGAIAYEEWVGERVGGVVPPGLGLAIRMINADGKPVYLDNCVDPTHSLVEAKGFNYGVAYEKWITKGDNRPWIWYESGMMKQAASQVQVARDQGWNLEWHFADEKVANYMREKFLEKGYPIKVEYTPPSKSLSDRFGRVREGSSDELRYHLGLRSRR